MPTAHRVFRGDDGPPPPSAASTFPPPVDRGGGGEASPEEAVPSAAHRVAAESAQEEEGGFLPPTAAAGAAATASSSPSTMATGRAADDGSASIDAAGVLVLVPRPSAASKASGSAAGPKTAVSSFTASRPPKPPPPPPPPPRPPTTAAATTTTKTTSAEAISHSASWASSYSSGDDEANKAFEAAGIAATAAAAAGGPPAGAAAPAAADAGAARATTAVGSTAAVTSKTKTTKTAKRTKKKVASPATAAVEAKARGAGRSAAGTSTAHTAASSATTARQRLEDRLNPKKKKKKKTKMMDATTTTTTTTTKKKKKKRPFAATEQEEESAVTMTDASAVAAAVARGDGTATETTGKKRRRLLPTARSRSEGAAATATTETTTKGATEAEAEAEAAVAPATRGTTANAAAVAAPAAAASKEVQPVQPPQEPQEPPQPPARPAMTGTATTATPPSSSSPTTRKKKRGRPPLKKRGRGRPPLKKRGGPLKLDENDPERIELLKAHTDWSVVPDNDKASGAIRLPPRLPPARGPAAAAAAAAMVTMASMATTTHSAAAAASGGVESKAKRSHRDDQTGDNDEAKEEPRLQHRPPPEKVNVELLVRLVPRQKWHVKLRPLVLDRGSPPLSDGFLVVDDVPTHSPLHGILRRYDVITSIDGVFLVGMECSKAAAKCKELVRDAARAASTSTTTTSSSTAPAGAATATHGAMASEGEKSGDGAAATTTTKPSNDDDGDDDDGKVLRRLTVRRPTVENPNDRFVPEAGVLVVPPPPPTRRSSKTPSIEDDDEENAVDEEDDDAEAAIRAQMDENDGIDVPLRSSSGDGDREAARDGDDDDSPVLPPLVPPSVVLSPAELQGKFQRCLLSVEDAMRVVRDNASEATTSASAVAGEGTEPTARGAAKAAAAASTASSDAVSAAQEQEAQVAATEDEEKGRKEAAATAKAVAAAKDKVEANKEMDKTKSKKKKKKKKKKEKGAVAPAKKQSTTTEKRAAKNALPPPLAPDQPATGASSSGIRPSPSPVQQMGPAAAAAAATAVATGAATFAAPPPAVGTAARPAPPAAAHAAPHVAGGTDAPATGGNDEVRSEDSVVSTLQRLPQRLASTDSDRRSLPTDLHYFVLNRTVLLGGMKQNRPVLGLRCTLCAPSDPGHLVVYPVVVDDFAKCVGQMTSHMLHGCRGVVGPVQEELVRAKRQMTRSRVGEGVLSLKDYLKRFCSERRIVNSDGMYIQFQSSPQNVQGPAPRTAVARSPHWNSTRPVAASTSQEALSKRGEAPHAATPMDGTGRVYVPPAKTSGSMPDESTAVKVVADAAPVVQGARSPSLTDPAFHAHLLASSKKAAPMEGVPGEIARNQVDPRRIANHGPPPFAAGGAHAPAFHRQTNLPFHAANVTVARPNTGGFMSPQGPLVSGIQQRMSAQPPMSVQRGGTVPQPSSKDQAVSGISTVAVPHGHHTNHGRDEQSSAIDSSITDHGSKRIGAVLPTNQNETRTTQPKDIRIVEADTHQDDMSEIKSRDAQNAEQETNGEERASDNAVKRNESARDSEQPKGISIAEVATHQDDESDMTSRAAQSAEKERNGEERPSDDAVARKESAASTAQSKDLSVAGGDTHQDAKSVITSGATQNAEQETNGKERASDDAVAKNERARGSEQPKGVSNDEVGTHQDDESEMTSRAAQIAEQERDGEDDAVAKNESAASTAQSKDISVAGGDAHQDAKSVITSGATQNAEQGIKGKERVPDDVVPRNQSATGTAKSKGIGIADADTHQDAKSITISRAMQNAEQERNGERAPEGVVPIDQRANSLAQFSAGTVEADTQHAETAARALQNAEEVGRGGERKPVEEQSDFLVQAGDRELVTEYLFALMSQVQPCVSSDGSKLIGFECTHCSGDEGAYQAFPSSVRRMKSHLPTLFDHLTSKCESVKQEMIGLLKRLEKQHVSQYARRPKSGQDQFFERIWDRLQRAKSFPSKARPPLHSKVVFGIEEAPAPGRKGLEAKRKRNLYDDVCVGDEFLIESGKASAQARLEEMPSEMKAAPGDDDMRNEVPNEKSTESSRETDKKLVTLESDHEIGQNVPLQGKIRNIDALVLPNDKKLVTDYVFSLLSQVQPCWTISGKHKLVGFECIHCCKEAEAYRVFPTSVRRIGSHLRPLHEHLQKKCSNFPKPSLSRLLEFEKIQTSQYAHRPNNGQAALFDLVWERMQAAKQPSPDQRANSKRPRQEDPGEHPPAQPPIVKRKRGRPRQNPVRETVEVSDSASGAAAAAVSTTPSRSSASAVATSKAVAHERGPSPRKRGRPRKNPVRETVEVSDSASGAAAAAVTTTPSRSSASAVATSKAIAHEGGPSPPAIGSPSTTQGSGEVGTVSQKLPSITTTDTRGTTEKQKKKVSETAATSQRTPESQDRNAASSKKQEISQHGMNNNRTALVSSSDKKLITEYLYFLMSQVQPCSSSGTVQNIGFECIHCSQETKTYQVFPTSVRRIPSQFRPLHNHLARKCPNFSKASLSILTALEKNQTSEYTHLPNSGQADFAERVWQRLQKGKAP